MSRILIVDDDMNNREILRLRLQHAGFEVQEATNGEEGVNAAQASPPDMIVLDVMMPKLDGWQVCRMLKSDLRTKRVPVVMLTARSQQIEELRGWESGADDYMTKPCDYKELIDKIHSFIAKRASAVEPS